MVMPPASLVEQVHERDTMIQCNPFQGQGLDGRTMVGISDFVGIFCSPGRPPFTVERIKGTNNKLISYGENVFTMEENSTGKCGTGGGIWLSSLLMVSWLLEDPGFFSGKSVLELGGGAGLGGVAVGRAPFEAASVKITDHEPELIALIKRNVDGNNTAESVSQSDRKMYMANDASNAPVVVAPDASVVVVVPDTAVMVVSPDTAVVVVAPDVAVVVVALLPEATVVVVSPDTAAVVSTPDLDAARVEDEAASATVEPLTSRPSVCRRATVGHLDWGHGDTDTTRYDIVIASDCVFNATAADFLEAVLQHVKPGGDLFIVNPPEPGRPGMDKLVYALAEHGEIEIRTTPMTMTNSVGGEIGNEEEESRPSFQKMLMMIHLSNFE
eukprot:2565144-Rhodomonas_salina.2